LEEKELIMTAKTHKNIFEGGIPDTYEKLCLAHFPRPIHDDVNWENTVQIIDALAGLPLNADQEDYLHILSEQVEEYERENVEPAPKFNALEMLRTACEETDTSQTALAKLLGVSEGLVSLILAGKRPITLEHAKKLGHHFNVKAELFLDLD
jgi:HTH-type transcriptional regulator/antitoxin HigA